MISLDDESIDESYEDSGESESNESENEENETTASAKSRLVSEAKLFVAANQNDKPENNSKKNFCIG